MLVSAALINSLATENCQTCRSNQAYCWTSTIRLNQNGRDYFDLHHTPDDTLDKIDPDELAQNIAAYAAAIYLIADSDVALKKWISSKRQLTIMDHTIKT